MSNSTKICGIYLIMNTVSGLLYVGQSHDIGTRWRQHRHLLRRQTERLSEGLALSKRCNRHLLFSWALHGEDAFHFTLLEECAEGDLTGREAYWLAAVRGYDFAIANTAGPSDNPMRGRKHSPETLRKMSAWSRAFVRTETHKARIALAHKGKDVSAETCAKISASKKGAHIPKLAGSNNPAARPGAMVRFRGSNNPVHKPGVIDKIAAANRKAVIDVDSGEEWKSATEVARALGVSIAAVSSATTGKSGRCKGRRLAYKQSQ